MRLQDEVAVITGASSGIGRQMALTFAREGAKVVVADIRQEPKEGGKPIADVIEALGGKAIFVPTDVTDEASVDHLVRTAVGEFGRLDIMVNNAGINIIKPALEMTLGEFDQVIRVNVRGVWIGATRALKEMVPRRRGKVVNTASNFGLVGCPNMAAYCASKSAVIGITKTLALEYSKHNININALCPGATKTSINMEIRQDAAVMAEWRKQTPLIREDGEFLGEPEHIAKAALFLASDESRYMTGSCLIVDGGWNAM